MTILSSSKLTNRLALTAWANKDLEHSHLVTAVAHYLLRLVLISFMEFKRNKISIHSSALTYIILLSLVPMLAMSTAIVKGLGGGDQLRTVAYSYISTLEENAGTKKTDHIKEAVATGNQPTSVPVSLTGHLYTAVDKLFDYVDKTNFATLGIFGVVGILISIFLVFDHIESAMNSIWKVSTARPLLRKIADYLTMLILMPLSINIAFAASAFLKNPALSSKLDKIIPFPWLQTLLLKPLPIFFIGLTLYAMYIFFPNTKVKALPAVIGSALAAILWLWIQNIYINLQVGVAKYNAIYGSFATLALLLIWIYLGWMFILIGAQVTFAIQNIKTYRLIPFVYSPSLKLGAAFDIATKIYSSFTKKQPVTTKELTNELPQYHPPVITDALNALMNAGLVHISQTDNRLLPVSSLEHFGNQEIVNIILGSEAPDTPGGKHSLRVINAAGKNNQN